VKSYQTLVNSNLIYEQTTANLAHQSIARQVETMVREFREAEQRHIGHTRLRDSEVLKALVFLLRLAWGRTSGRPKSRAFVDFLFAAISGEAHGDCWARRGGEPHSDSVVRYPVIVTESSPPDKA